MLVDAGRKGVSALDGLVDDADDAAIAAITVAELVVGAELADGKRRAAREAFLAEILGAISVEDYGLDVAREHGALLAHTRRSGRPRGAHDLIIAATARARQREVVSDDLEGFAELPLVALRRIGGDA